MDGHVYDHQLARRRMAPELEACAFDRRLCRRAAFDKAGNDVRLATFGLNWQLMSEKREEIFTDYMNRIQDVFDELYGKITGGKRSSIDNHLLPTIKTPAIRRTRPQVERKEDEVGKEEEENDSAAQNVSVQPGVLSPPKRSRRLRKNAGHTRKCKASTKTKVASNRDCTGAHEEPSTLELQLEDDISTAIVADVPPPVEKHQKVLEPAGDMQRSDIAEQSVSMKHVEPEAVPPAPRRSLRLGEKAGHIHKAGAKTKVAKSPGVYAEPSIVESQLEDDISTAIVTDVLPPVEELLEPAVRESNITEQSVSVKHVEPEVLPTPPRKSLRLRKKAGHTHKFKAGTETKVEASRDCTGVHEEPSTLKSQLEDNMPTAVVSDVTPPVEEDQEVLEPASDVQESEISEQSVTPKSMHRVQGSGGRVSPFGRVINIGELRASHSRIPTPTTVTKPHPLQQTNTPSRTTMTRSKRLRSISLEQLPLELESVKKPAGSSGDKSDTQTDLQSSDSDGAETSETTETPDEGGFSSAEKTDSDPEPPSANAGSKTKTATKAAALWQLMHKKGDSNGVATKLALSNLNHGASFLPRNSPKKPDTFESRQQKLVEKLQRKKEEEEKRQRDIAHRKQQQLEEKARKREERLRKVAENQATLRREEEEKRKRAQGMKTQDSETMKQRLFQKKAKEIEERNRRAKAHLKGSGKPPLTHQKEEHDKKRFEQIMASKQAGIATNRFVQKWKELNSTPVKTALLGSGVKDTVTKSKPTSVAHGPSPANIHAVASGTVVKSKPHLTSSQIAAKPALDSTFTLNSDAGAGYHTPLWTQQSHNSNYTMAPSYEMTPVEKQDPFLVYSNYDITGLSDDDSTDDEDHPRKPIPEWAHPQVLNKWMLRQEEKLDSQDINVALIFPPEQLLQMPDLGRIFKTKRRRFYQRSSSAQWDSPMLKKARQD